MAEAPIVIKRKRVFASDSHHGGQWKVAYADFVTAMMAFFMLLWLLNVTSEEQREGLAAYFDPTAPLTEASAGGIDLLSGDSINTLDRLVSDNHGGSDASMMKNEEAVQVLADSLSQELTKGQARLTLTPEGIVVDLMDTEGEPIFPLGSSQKTVRLADILTQISPALARSGRPIKLVGHTDNRRYTSGSYTNWELSADRANAARRGLLQLGIRPTQIVEVSGQADRLPISNDPGAPENRRIAIILLNQRPTPLAQR